MSSVGLYNYQFPSNIGILTVKKIHNCFQYGLYSISKTHLSQNYWLIFFQGLNQIFLILWEYSIESQ